MKVLVLLSSYNGERFIQEQLDSLLEQKQCGVEIVVRDDGSTDRTVEILEQYRQKGLLTYSTGVNIGYAGSFWTMLHDCGEADYYAFCDQDDVWDREKLESAIVELEKLKSDIPSLYFSDVRVTDSGLSTVSDHMVRPMPIDYPHSLIRNIAPGCTYVFNHAASKLLKLYDAERLGLDTHDWTVYRIVSCFGQIVFDPVPHMSYRQHDDNSIGAKFGPEKYIEKIGSFINGRMTSSRRKFAEKMLIAYGDRMCDENLEITRMLAEYPESLRKRIKLIKCGKLDFPGIERLFMQLLILIGRF